MTKDIIETLTNRMTELITPLSETNVSKGKIYSKVIAYKYIGYWE